MSSGKGLTLVKTTLLPGHNGVGVGIASENDIAIYCNISFKYCDILQYIEQVSRIRKTMHILLKSIKK